MKSYWEYTERERSEFTDEQVRSMLDRRCFTYIASPPVRSEPIEVFNPPRSNDSGDETAELCGDPDFMRLFEAGVKDLNEGRRISADDLNREQWRSGSPT